MRTADTYVRVRIESVTKERAAVLVEATLSKDLGLFEWAFGPRNPMKEKLDA